MKALIDIEVNGLYCDMCHQVSNSQNTLQVHYTCSEFHEDLELDRHIRDTKRCEPCLAATARAQELLGAEAELKRVKAAEQYENERMP